MKKENRILFGMLIYYFSVTVLYFPIVSKFGRFEPIEMVFGYNLGIIRGVVSALFGHTLYALNMNLLFLIVVLISACSVVKGVVTTPLITMILVFCDVPTIVSNLTYCFASGDNQQNIFTVISLFLTLVFDAVLVVFLLRYIFRHRNGFKTATTTNSILRTKVGAAMLAEALMSAIAIAFGKVELLVNNFTSTKTADFIRNELASNTRLWTFIIGYLFIIALCGIMTMRGANDALPIAAALHIFDALALSASILYRATRSSGNGVWDVVGLCVHLAIDIAIIWAVLKIEQNSKLAEKQA